MGFRILMALSVLAFSACGGSGGSSDSPPPAPAPPPLAFTTGGTVSNLTGTVVLQNNGGDNLSISASGAFTFATRVVNGGAYAVTVITQPATQTCAVTSGSGTLTANVTQVAIACVDNAPPAPAAPLVDDARTASGTVGIGGGTVAVTSAGGITYTLEVPPGAVDSPTEIRMAPVVNMGGAPLASGLLGAVRFEPSGLEFRVPAQLTISPLPQAGGRPLLVGFNTANDGGNFNLEFAERDGTSVIVDVRHFSIGGVSEATQAEFAEIPLEPLGPTFTADAANSAVFDLILAGGGENVEQAAEVLQRWYQTLVRPAIDSAVSSDFESQDRALAAYMVWLQTYNRLVDLGIDSARLSNGLTAALTHANEHMPDLMLMTVDLLIDDCFEEESLAPLSIASTIQQLSTELGFAPVGSPLDRTSFRARVNGCLRVVLDPVTLPSPLTVGVDSSLDARAQVVFNENPTPVGAPFQFTVTPNNSTVATSPGFSNAEGRFTTVFRPTALPVSFNVRACLVLPGMEISDICVAQAVSPAGGALVMSKRIDHAFAAEHGRTGEVGSFITQLSGTDHESTYSYAITRDTVNAIDRGGFIDARATCSTVPLRGGNTQIHFSIVVTLAAPSNIRIRGTPTYSGTGVDSPDRIGRAFVTVFLGGRELGGTMQDATPFEIFTPLSVGENVISMGMDAQCAGTGRADISNTFEISIE